MEQANIYPQMSSASSSSSSSAEEVLDIQVSDVVGSGSFGIVARITPSPVASVPAVAKFSRSTGSDASIRQEHHVVTSIKSKVDNIITVYDLMDNLKFPHQVCFSDSNCGCAKFELSPSSMAPAASSSAGKSSSDKSAAPATLGSPRCASCGCLAFCHNPLSKPLSLSQEYGHSLPHFVHHLPVTFRRLLALPIFYQLLHTLQQLRSIPMAHNDIKPDNMLLGTDFKLRLIDFGLAIQGPECKNVPLTGFFGTAHYAAPELFQTINKNAPLVEDDLYESRFDLDVMERNACIARGEAIEKQEAAAPSAAEQEELKLSTYDATAADIWSAAVSLYELLNGASSFSSRPFTPIGSKTPPAAEIDAHVRQQVTKNITCEDTRRMLLLLFVQDAQQRVANADSILTSEEFKASCSEEFRALFYPNPEANDSTTERGKLMVYSFHHFFNDHSPISLKRFIDACKRYKTEVEGGGAAAAAEGGVAEGDEAAQLAAAMAASLSVSDSSGASGDGGSGGDGGAKAPLPLRGPVESMSLNGCAIFCAADKPLVSILNFPQVRSAALLLEAALRRFPRTDLMELFIPSASGPSRYRRPDNFKFVPVAEGAEVNAHACIVRYFGGVKDLVVRMHLEQVPAEEAQQGETAQVKLSVSKLSGSQIDFSVFYETLKAKMSTYDGRRCDKCPPEEENDLGLVGPMYIDANADSPSYFCEAHANECNPQHLLIRLSRPIKSDSLSQLRFPIFPDLTSNNDGSAGAAAALPAAAADAIAFECSLCGEKQKTGADRYKLFSPIAEEANNDYCTDCFHSLKQKWGTTFVRIRFPIKGSGSAGSSRKDEAKRLDDAQVELPPQRLEAMVAAVPMAKGKSGGPPAAPIALRDEVAAILTSSVRLNRILVNSVY